MNKLNTCVLIMSCDKYDDVWDPFFHFFEKYWADCPYPVYLATNTKVYHRENLQQVHSNISGTWSEETSSVLKNLSYDYLIYLQDDYFILKKVDTQKITLLLNKLEAYQADYLRLFPIIGPDSDFNNDQDLGLISVDAPYRTSLQCAIWKRKSFLSILDNTENQWEFEMNSPGRSQEFLFLSIKQQTIGKFKFHVYPITYYHLTAIIRGKWRQGILKICREENVELNMNYRKVEPFGEFIYQIFYDQSPLCVKKTMDFIKSKF